MDVTSVYFKRQRMASMTSFLNLNAIRCRCQSSIVDMGTDTGIAPDRAFTFHIIFTQNSGSSPGTVGPGDHNSPPQDANTMCADLCCMLLLWYIDITLRSPSVLILSYRTVRGWNRLPQGTVQISTPEAFKSAFLRFIQRRRWCSYAKYVLSRLTSCWLDRFYEMKQLSYIFQGETVSSGQHRVYLASKTIEGKTARRCHWTRTVTRLLVLNLRYFRSKRISSFRAAVILAVHFGYRTA